MYGWISWIVLAQSEFRIRDISSPHVFATVKNPARESKSEKHSIAIFRSSSGGRRSLASNDPKEKPMLDAK
jgi:hypothetical protein